MGFPGGSVVKYLPATAGDSGWGRSPGGKKWQPTPIFMHEKSHGKRNLADCSQ